MGFNAGEWNHDMGTGLLVCSGVGCIQQKQGSELLAISSIKGFHIGHIGLLDSFVSQGGGIPCIPMPIRNPPFRQSARPLARPPLRGHLTGAHRRSSFTL